MVIPGIVGITPVDDENTALGQLERSGRDEVWGLTIRDGHECGQQSSVIQTHMEFDRPLGGLIPRPGKDAQAEIDRGGIERAELVLEAEAMSWRRPLATGEKFAEQGLVEGAGLLLIDPGQRRPADGMDAEMVELSALS